MKFVLSLLSIGLIFIGLSTFQDAKAEKTNAPVVVELFTSQSCSSCPPADEVLQKIQSENDNVIALSCNVTYWNHLHWKDTLSQEFCSTRQRNYAASVGSGRVYTPQTVVNAQAEMVGSQERKVRKAVYAANKLQPVKLMQNKGKLIVELPTLTTNVYYPTIMFYGNNHTQSIPSGENRGRTVEYTNPVTQLENLKPYRGQAQNINVPLSIPPNTKGAAILIHKNTLYGPIVAAGKIEF